MIDLDIPSTRALRFPMTIVMPELDLPGYGICKEDKPKKSQFKKIYEEARELRNAARSGDVIEMHKEYFDLLQTTLNVIQMLPIPESEASSPKFFAEDMASKHLDKMKTRSLGGDALEGKDRRIKIAGEFKIIRK